MECPPEFWCISKVAAADGVVGTFGIVLIVVVVIVLVALSFPTPRNPKD